MGGCVFGVRVVVHTGPVAKALRLFSGVDVCVCVETVEKRALHCANYSVSGVEN